MYLAPEIASGHSHSSHGYPVDWWGLGCVLFELVVGEWEMITEIEDIMSKIL